MSDKNTKNPNNEEKNKSDMNYTNRSNRRSSKKWLKWFIFILVLGGIITLIWYFSTDHYVNVRNVSRISLAQDGNKQKITIERNKGKELTASSNEISDLISAEYYVTGGNKTSYHLYISNTNIGKLSIGLVDYFKLGEIKTENNQGILTTIHYMNIGGWSISYAEYNGNYYTQNGEQWALLNDKILNDKNLIILYKAFSNALTTATIPSSSNIGYILLQLLPTVIIVGLFVWYFSKMSRLQGGGEESIWSVGKSQAKLAKSKYKFSDVAGLKEEKDELIEIVDYLKNPNKYAAMGARVPKGVILYGPPGTGKTLLAKAVAGEAKVPFYQVSGSSFEDMLVGVGAKRVRDLFNNAKKSAPSIIFIDELDSVAAKRGRADVVGPSAGIADQTINQLLAEMDGFDTKSGVVIIAATNRLDVLDEAILRPGRFDRHVQINLPDIKERELILQIHAKNKNISSKVNLNDIARRTPGFSGAQLENVLNEATLLTVRNNKTAVGMEEIDEAIDRVIAGPAKHSRVITEAEKKQIAYHEAGHALVGLNLPGSDVVEKITIIPRGQAAGYTLSTPEKQEITIQKKSDLLAIIASTLAGRAAEEIVYGKENISTGAANDLFKVTKITKSMVTQLGMTELGMTQLIPSEGIINPYSKQYSEQTAQKIDAVVEKIIQKQYAKAKQIIEKNRKELDLIVDALLVLETIVKSQIDYIHKNKKLPNEVLEKKKNYV